MFLTYPAAYRASVLHVIFAVACLLTLCRAGYGQSTFGTVLGTIKDPSGSFVPMAKVSLMNTGTNAEHSTISNSNGGYEFVNVEIGTYKLTVEAPGFQKTEYQAFDMAARDTKRIDIDLK